MGALLTLTATGGAPVVPTDLDQRRLIAFAAERPRIGRPRTASSTQLSRWPTLVESHAEWRTRSQTARRATESGLVTWQSGSQVYQNASNNGRIRIYKDGSTWKAEIWKKNAQGNYYRYSTGTLVTSAPLP